MPQKTLFLHIPKTAGQSLNAILASQHDPSRIYRLYQCEALEGFKTLPEEERTRFTCVMGHTAYGLHEYYQGCTYVTMVRQPVARVLSLYYYVRSRSGHYLWQQATKGGLEDCLRDRISVEFDNGQVRLLSGRYDVPYGTCSRDMLEQAKANVTGSFAVVGLTERFDESVALMKKRLVWKSLPYYKRENVNRTKPSQHQAEERVLSLIRSHNAYDLEFYSWAKSRFEETLALESSEIHAEIRRMKLANTAKAPFAMIRRNVWPRFKRGLGTLIRLSS
jgi:Sulfotransferase family